MITAQQTRLDALEQDLRVARQAAVSRAEEAARLTEELGLAQVTLRAISDERIDGLHTPAAQAALVLMERYRGGATGEALRANRAEGELGELFEKLRDFPVQLQSTAEGRAVIRQAGTRALELLGVCTELLDVEELYARTISRQEVAFVNAQRGFVVGDLRKVLGRYRKPRV